ncbi:MAG: hypothetical protein JKY10_12040 [Cohaesibacteraceae bacterium]|nr:hypothetical protein [Cohaesibacteraceae bacterium]MBL4877205.1 hypothetical protein [Cohaesibacteraceae bacterium]
MTMILNRWCRLPALCLWGWAKADDFFAAPQSVYGQQLLRETPSLAMIERGE